MSQPTPTPNVTPALIGPPSLSDLLNSATADVEPRVNIPAAIESYLAEQVNVFAARTNRFRRTMNMNDAISPAVLANRPTAQKLTGQPMREAAAKEFARQVRQFAADHGLSTVPVTNGASVTFRFAKVRPAKPTAPVTVTHVAQ